MASSEEGVGDDAADSAGGSMGDSTGDSTDNSVGELSAVASDFSVKVFGVGAELTAGSGGFPEQPLRVNRAIEVARHFLKQNLIITDSTQFLPDFLVEEDHP